MENSGQSSAHIKLCLLKGKFQRFSIKNHPRFNNKKTPADGALCGRGQSGPLFDLISSPGRAPGLLAGDGR